MEQRNKIIDIDPLLDELERLKAEKKPFPSLQECLKWWKFQENPSLNDFYAYFSQFQYETKVFPKKGDIVEGETTTVTIRGKILDIRVSDENKIHYCKSIRPVTTPTREEVIAKYGLTEQELEILKG